MVCFLVTPTLDNGGCTIIFEPCPVAFETPSNLSSEVSETWITEREDLREAVQSPFFLETDSKPYQLNHVHHLQKLIYLLTTPQFLWRCFILNLPRSLAICFTLYTRNISKASPKKPGQAANLSDSSESESESEGLGPRTSVGEGREVLSKKLLGKKKMPQV